MLRGLEIYVDQQKKIVEFWLSKAESTDNELRSSLAVLYPIFQDMGFCTAVFSSGKGSLVRLTEEMLCNNVRSAEL